LPFTVSVKPLSPAGTLDGAMEVITGGMMAIVSGTGVDAGKPGVSTVTEICFAEVRSLAKTETVSLVMLTKVVVRGEPSNETIDSSVKPCAVDRQRERRAFTGAAFGLSDVMAGPPDESVTLNSTGAEVVC